MKRWFARCVSFKSLLVIGEPFFFRFFFIFDESIKDGFVVVLALLFPDGLGAILSLIFTAVVVIVARELGGEAPELFFCSCFCCSEDERLFFGGGVVGVVVFSRVVVVVFGVVETSPAPASLILWILESESPDFRFRAENQDIFILSFASSIKERSNVFFPNQLADLGCNASATKTRCTTA